MTGQFIYLRLKIGVFPPVGDSAGPRSSSTKRKWGAQGPWFPQVPQQQEGVDDRNVACISQLPGPLSHAPLPEANSSKAVRFLLLPTQSCMVHHLNDSFLSGVKQGSMSQCVCACGGALVSL